MSNLKFSPSGRSLSARSFILFFSFLFFSVNLFTQNPCSDNRLSGGPDLVSGSECFEYSFSYNTYYSGAQSPAPTSYQVSYLHIFGDLSGDGYISSVIPLGALANFVYTDISSDGQHFDYYLFCTEPPANQPQYTINYGEDLFQILVHANPSTSGQANEVSIVNLAVESYTLPTGIGSCSSPPTPCTWVPPGGQPGILEVPIPAMCSGLTLEIEGLPLNGEQVPPHEEVGPITIKLTNNTGGDITIEELDFLLKVTDEFSNLPDVTPYMVPNIPTNSEPLFESHEGDNHYYNIDELMTGNVLANGQEVVILAFSIFPPEGLENLEGLSYLSVEFFRIKYSDSSGSVCCGVDVSGTIEQMHFLGELPCTFSTPYVSFDLVPLAAGTAALEDCEVGFNVVIRIQDDILGGGLSNVEFEQIYLEIETPVTGNMMHSEVIPDPVSGFVVCPATTCPSTGSSCYECGGDRVIFDFDNPAMPLILDDGEYFTVILSGLNGSLDDAEIKQAKFRLKGEQNACIPNIIANQPGDFPLESGCNFCNSVQIELADYGQYETPPPPPLATCEKGFSVYLNTSDISENYSHIAAELMVSTSGNVSLSGNSDLCSLCLTQNGETFTFDYTPQFPFTYPRVRLFDVIVTGVGCIESAMFTASTEVTLTTSSGALTCNPKENSPNNPLQQGGLCTTCFAGQYTVGGNIHNENGIGINVPVQGIGGEDSGIFIVGEVESSSDCDPFNDQQANCTDITSTAGACDGSYEFEINCNTDDEFTVIPWKDINPTNGVTTFDMVLIQKHILGISILNSPYKIFAADVDKSTTVTTFDLVQLQKIILQIITEFPGDQSSWRFIDATYQFPDPLNPWVETFPECIHVDLSNQQGQANVDFVAVKIGDVNNSHNCSMLTSDNTEDRSPGFSFVLGEIKEMADGTIELPIFAGSAEPIVAWQMGLKFDTRFLRLVEANAGDIVGMTNQNLGLTELDKGHIRALWYSPDTRMMSFESEPAVLTLRFERLQHFDDISEVFRLDDTVLRCEAYKEDGTVRPIHFIASNQAPLSITDSSSFFARVSPNPFSQGLSLEVNMPVASRLEIVFADRFGRQVGRWEGNIEAGFHSVNMEEADRWPSGMYHWQARIANGEVSGQVLKQ